MKIMGSSSNVCHQNKTSILKKKGVFHNDENRRKRLKKKAASNNMGLGIGVGMALGAAFGMLF